MLTIILLSMILGVAHSTEVLSFLQEGTCAPFSLMEGFQMDQYVGRWYTLQQVSNGYLTLTKCVTNFLSLTDDGLQVETSGRTSQGDVGSSRAALVYHNGTAENDVPFLQLNAPFVPPVPYHVVHTDYFRVSCVYSCKGLLHVKGEAFWVLSRDKTLDPRLLQMCLWIFATNGLDVGRLQPVDQEGCEDTLEEDLRNSEEGEILTPDEGKVPPRPTYRRTFSSSEDSMEEDLENPEEGEVLTPDEGKVPPRPTNLKTSLSEPDEGDQMLLVLANEDPEAAGHAYTELPPHMALLFLVALWLARMA